MTELETLDRIEQIAECYRAALRGEAAVAHAHAANSYFTSGSGRNVSADERLAIWYAGRLDLKPRPEELKDHRQYLRRLLAEFEVIKSSYRIEEDDPDGYGIGTLHSVSAKLEALAKSLETS